MEIKAINTKYKGYNFRSRTEARWAVFFDEIGWDWQYEAEGFDLPSGPYLPDFYFPKLNYYAEVKGKAFTMEEKQKCKELSADGSTVILLDGPPNPKHYDAYMEGDEICNVVFVPSGDKYYPLYYTHDYWPEFFSETSDAVMVALSKRFEFDGK